MSSSYTNRKCWFASLVNYNYIHTLSMNILNNNGVIGNIYIMCSPALHTWNISNLLCPTSSHYIPSHLLLHYLRLTFQFGLPVYTVSDNLVCLRMHPHTAPQNVLSINPLYVYLFYILLCYTISTIILINYYVNNHHHFYNIYIIIIYRQY